MTAPTVKLNNGYEMPILGLGTYLARDDEGIQAVKDAIDAGYRHVDTAYFYWNEHQVGQAIKDKVAEGVIKREDMFVVTKLWNIHHDPNHVEWACRKSLENMGLDYIDLYLMHTPMGYEFRGNAEPDLMPKNADGTLNFSDVDYLDTYKAMEKLVDAGFVRSLGVSNFNSEQIDRILSECKIKPVTNQVECNPSINQKKLIKFCKERDIVLTAYSPLGRPHALKEHPNLPKPAMQDVRVQAIGEKYGRTPGQIVLKYLIQIGAVPIPKSTNKERIQKNIEIFDFELTEDEMKVMDSFNNGERTVPFALCTKHKYFPFNIDF